ncbi:site-specific integrase [Enterococcus sp. BWR-S5]|uniref:site-specific integrase n=1 Tax=Enterococcus sp. BWR-S5 TaxID=2787714 RepID=UPI001922D98E|nr:site-specific integrase [Enterococcus sp. BWR-S5]MBL1223706.1 site-specific integrase [Enterococcus sp. BWR-S5]
MATIKQYTKKDGSTAYMFKKYLGVDPVTGKQKETTRRGFASKKEAKLALSRLEVEVSEGYLQIKKNMSFYDAFEVWFNEVYKFKVKESTYWNTKLIFDKHILPVFGSLKLNRVNVAYCQKQANIWRNSSPKRYQRFINYTGMVFKYGVSIGELQSDPMGKIILPSPIENDEEQQPNFFDKDELLFFLQYMKDHYSLKRFTFFFLLAYTGLRKGEALCLTWRDIDLKKKLLTVNKTLASGQKGALLIQKPKTTASNRSISLDNDIVEVLKSWKLQQLRELESLGHIHSLEQLVFSTIDNTLMYPRTPQSWLDVFYRKNHHIKRITVHGFRHTHASLLFEAGANMKQVQSRLGHTTIKTTMNVYTHVTKESKEATAEIFSTFMRTKNNLGQSLGQKKPLS